MKTLCATTGRNDDEGSRNGTPVHGSSEGVGSPTKMDVGDHGATFGTINLFSDRCGDVGHENRAFQPELGSIQCA